MKEKEKEIEACDKSSAALNWHPRRQGRRMAAYAVCGASQGYKITNTSHDIHWMTVQGSGWHCVEIKSVAARINASCTKPNEGV